MASFKDAKGREWHVKLSLPVIIEICEKMKLRLADITELNFPLSEVLKAIPVVCRDQMKELGVTQQEFNSPDVLGPRQIGSALSAMQEAVMEAFQGNEDTEDFEPVEASEGNAKAGPTDPGPSET